MSTFAKTLAALDLDDGRYTSIAWSIDGGGLGDTHVQARGEATALCGAEPPTMRSLRARGVQGSTVLSRTRPVTCQDCLGIAEAMDR